MTAKKSEKAETITLTTLCDSARIDFWNPVQPEETQKRNTSKKLNDVGLLDEFEYGGYGGGMFKVFNLEKYGNIQTIDHELYNFVKYLFDVLRQ